MAEIGNDNEEHALSCGIEIKIKSVKGSHCSRVVDGGNGDSAAAGFCSGWKWRRDACLLTEGSMLGGRLQHLQSTLLKKIGHARWLTTAILQSMLLNF
jgi:hypothetical protein